MASLTTVAVCSMIHTELREQKHIISIVLDKGKKNLRGLDVQISHHAVVLHGTPFPNMSQE